MQRHYALAAAAQNIVVTFTRISFGKFVFFGQPKSHTMTCRLLLIPVKDFYILLVHFKGLFFDLKKTTGPIRLWITVE